MPFCGGVEGSTLDMKLDTEGRKALPKGGKSLQNATEDLTDTHTCKKIST